MPGEAAAAAVGSTAEADEVKADGAAAGEVAGAVAGGAAGATARGSSALKTGKDWLPGLFVGLEMVETAGVVGCSEVVETAGVVGCVELVEK